MTKPRKPLKPFPSKDVTAVADAFVVSPAKDKWRPHRRGWRGYEFVQIALSEIYRGKLPPQHVDQTALTVRVNGWLTEYPEWRAGCFGKVSRKTVIRALAKYRENNSPKQ